MVDLINTAGSSPAAAPMAPMPYRVTRRRHETHDTATITIAPVGEPVATPRPGQFHMLYAFGIGEVPISVSGLDREDGIEHTIRAVGLTTEALSGSSVGDIIGVRGPFGTVWDIDAARGDDVIVMAGGIGLAPLRPVIEHLLAHPGDHGSVNVLVGARSPAELVYADELAAIARRDDVHLAVTVDSSTPEWRGRVGVVTTVIDSARFDPGHTRAFVCGPEAMMRFGIRALLDRGVAPERIQLSAERNMACAVGHCGHCQYGPVLVCRDGAVFDYPRLAPLLGVREL